MNEEGKIAFIGIVSELVVRQREKLRSIESDAEFVLFDYIVRRVEYKITYLRRNCRAIVSLAKSVCRVEERRFSSCATFAFGEIIFEKSTVGSFRFKTVPGKRKMR